MPGSATHVRVQHIVETRFSVRMRSNPAPTSPDWLEERLRLLRRFCLPSVAAQTVESFTWLVFCDRATDAATLAELQEHERSVPQMRVALTDDARPPLAIVHELLDPCADVLITTRLDSDDAICDSYVELVQGYAGPFQLSRNSDMLVNFLRGYRLDEVAGRLYETRMPNSPFHSMLERPRSGPPATVMRALSRDRYAADHGSHHSLHLHHVTHQDVSSVAWLQVVHGGNLKNELAPLDRECDLGAGAPPGFTIDRS